MFGLIKNRYKFIIQWTGIKHWDELTQILVEY